MDESTHPFLKNCPVPLWAVPEKLAHFLLMKLFKITFTLLPSELLILKSSTLLNLQTLPCMPAFLGPREYKFVKTKYHCLKIDVLH